MIVRELLTKLGYQVDEKGIEHAKDALGGLKKFAAGLALGATFVAATKSAIGMALQMENLQSNFEVLLGSADKAKKFSDELVAFAAKTPYALGSIFDVAAGLLTYDVSIQDTTKYLGQLGDIALGSEEKMASMGRILGQIASSGRMQGQDLMQFINAGFNPLVELSKMTGRSVLDLRKDMEQGKISFEMVTEAMRVATSEGGKFYKGMEKGSKTLSGMWSTAIDTIRLALGKMANAFFPLMKQVLAYISAIDFSGMEAFFERTAAGVQEMVTTIQNSYALPALLEVRAAFMQLLAAIRETVTEVGDGNVWQFLARVLIQVIGAVATITKAFIWFGRAVVWVSQLLGPFRELLAPLLFLMTAMWSLNLITQIIMATFAAKGFAVAMFGVSAAQMAAGIATAKTTLAFIWEALALKQIGLAAHFAGGALKAMALVPVPHFIALGVILAGLLYTINKINEAEAKALKEIQDQAEEKEFQRAQGMWADRRVAVAKTRKEIEELKAAGVSESDGRIQDLKERLSNEEMLLRVHSRALDKAAEERNARLGKKPDEAPDFNASIDMAGQNASVEMQRLVDGQAKQTTVTNNVSVDVSVPTDSHGGTPLTAGGVKDIAHQAMRAALSVEMQKILIATL